LRQAVFLDRDGVINETVIRNGKPSPPASIEDLRVPLDVSPALHQLTAGGYLLIGITNQPDVARGAQTKEAVEKINRHLLESLPIESILVCYHDDSDDCACRKPRPGLILEAAHKWNVERQASFVIGDRWKDIEAGKRAGCKTIWLDRHYDEDGHGAVPDHRAETLAQAAAWILSSGAA